jgi:hypothetical protein
MKKLFTLLPKLALGGISIVLVWLVVINTDLRFLPIFRHFSLKASDLAADQQEILRHIPIGSSLEDVQNSMKRNGFTCRNVTKGERYDTGYIYAGQQPLGGRDFLACYLVRQELPCGIARRVEIDNSGERLTKLTVYGDHFCLW